MSELHRRSFLKLTALGALGEALPGCGADEPVLADTGPALPRKLPGSLLRGSATEQRIDLRVLSGRLPGDLYGHVFITSPLPYGDGSHVFNGEAMLYRVDFGGSRVELQSGLLKTPCYYAEMAAQGTSHAFNNVGIARISGTLGFRSMPNTAPVWFGDGRLLCAVDAARPYEVDPNSLRLLGPMGRQSEWLTTLPASLAARPFKPIFTLAHPFFDQHTNEVFAINYTLSGVPGVEAVTELKRWDGAGRLETFRLVGSDGTPVSILQSAHQIAITEDYVLVMETAFLAEAEQIFGQSVARPQLPETVLYLVRRADLRDGSEAEARRIVIPREAAHIVADYANPGGTIRIHLAHLTSTDLSEWLQPSDMLFGGGKVREDLMGLFAGGVDRNMLGRYEIDAASAKVTDAVFITDDDFCWATLFYNHRDQMPHDRFEHLYYASFGFSPENLTQKAVDLYRDHPHRQVPIDDLPLEGRPANLFRLDVDGMEIVDGFAFPDGRVPSSPQFVPADGRSGATEGYMVCTVASDDRKTPGSSGDELWVFDAANLGQGPLCRLGSPELDLAFTIHTTWMPELVARRAEYLVTAREDYGESVEAMEPEVRELFEREVFPHFDPGV